MSPVCSEAMLLSTHSFATLLSDEDEEEEEEEEVD